MRPAASAVSGGADCVKRCGGTWCTLMTRPARPASAPWADLGFFGLDDQPDDDPVIVTGRKPPGTTDSPMPRRNRTG
ncbi:hypothetical protein GCM10010451_42240 [Streptomyces virens]|uniref:Uncharacterized protein n=2 Tax=Streptomyces TaxID=1883 RepID=A0ABP6PUR2_9ACTN